VLNWFFIRVLSRDLRSFNRSVTVSNSLMEIFETQSSRFLVLFIKSDAAPVEEIREEIITPESTKIFSMLLACAFGGKLFLDFWKGF